LPGGARGFTGNEGKVRIGNFAIETNAPAGLRGAGPARAAYCATQLHAMLINFVLVFLIFGAGKKKLNRYLAAAIYGAIKAALTFVVTANLATTALNFAIYAGLATTLMALLERIDKKEATENTISDYSMRRKSSFKWEYVPLSAVVVFLLFGEMLVTLFVVSEA
jgi:hypothetical protein